MGLWGGGGVLRSATEICNTRILRQSQAIMKNKTTTPTLKLQLKRCQFSCYVSVCCRTRIVQAPRVKMFTFAAALLVPFGINLSLACRPDACKCKINLLNHYINPIWVSALKSKCRSHTFVTFSCAQSNWWMNF